MDVTIRVQAIRQFSTQQMALLIDNSAVILNRTKRQSGSEVLYAAGWIVGEFSDLLTSPEETLQSLLRGMVPTLPSHIQSVYIQAMVKIFAMTAQESRDLEAEMIRKLETLVTSSDLEVQERASTSLQILKYVVRQREKGETEGFVDEIKTFYAGELNPVGPKAQKKVPVPEGLDLDAWINEPEEEEESDEDEPEAVNGGNVFVQEDPDS